MSRVDRFMNPFYSCHNRTTNFDLKTIALVDAE